MFRREDRGRYVLREIPAEYGPTSGGEISVRSYSFGRSKLFEADCISWLQEQPHNSVHAVVTDPPYGLIEYTSTQQEKLRIGKGGIWRIPPSFDGAKRSPLPRFTVLSTNDLEELARFFFNWSRALLPVLVPGANVVVASNPLLSYVVAGALARAGLERRGEVVRLVMTMRGGDRPKAAHEEFFGVSVMPRSMWEPWLLLRKPIEGRVQDNLRKWKTGGFRRPSKDRPFGDVIPSAPTHKFERRFAAHPSLKPQAFLRTVVRGVLPLGDGVVLDPFAGSGSTLAAAEAVGYESIGIEKDSHYFELACKAIPKLTAFKNGDNYTLFNL
jgi:site-specific DNA-methyltransferase (adenine-specific)